MKSLLVILLVIFVLWMYMKGMAPCNAYPLYGDSSSPRIDHYQESNDDDVIDEYDFNTLLHFGEIREDLVVDDQESTVDPQQTIQSIDERYKSAKRKTPEDKMTRGVYNSAEKRRLVEKLIQRPTKKGHSRPKLWRHEFSDRLRGDVVPTHENKWDINKNSLTAKDSAQGIFATLNGGVWAADEGGTPIKDDDHMMYTMSDTKARQS